MCSLLTFGVDLFQRRVSLAGIIARVGQPVARLPAGIDDALERDIDLRDQGGRNQP